LDSIRDALPAYWAEQGKKSRLVREEPIGADGRRGRAFEFAIGDTHRFRTNVFIVSRHVYRAIAVTPTGLADDREARRFLDSFRIETLGK
jgi:hypothetical protein